MESCLPLHLVSADKMGFQISLFHKIIAPGTAAVHVLLELMWCYITMYLLCQYYHHVGIVELVEVHYIHVENQMLMCVRVPLLHS